MLYLSHFTFTRGFVNPSNQEVREQLYDMVGHGITSVSEMRRRLKNDVDTHTGSS